MSLRWLVCLVVACLASMPPLAAQEKPFTVTIRREWEGARTSAPLSLRAYLTWKKPELLEGRLHVNAFVDQTRISRWVSPVTALSSSEQALWFLTPRPILPDKYSRYTLEAEFLGSKHLFDPEQLDVDVPVRSKRVMVVAIVVQHRATTPTGLGAETNPSAFEKSLLLQNFLEAAEVPELQVFPSRVAPLDFPAESMRLMGLDALLISHDMLNSLRSTQLEAIRIWVMAGGSMGLIQTGELVDASSEFVKSLRRQEWNGSTKASRLVPESIHVYSPGLGQLIVAPHAMPGDSSEWARVANLMLRVNDLSAAQTQTSGRLRLRDPRPGNSQAAYPQSVDDLVSALEPRPRFSLDELTRQLMPSSIQGMPFWLAASILSACLFCVGPGDYLLLGWLKRRRWTWVLFPAIALGFTGWMAHLAAEHNGRNDSRNWISIVDITPENEVVRTSRLELNYGASGRTVAHEVKNQWWTDLRSEDLVEYTEQDLVERMMAQKQNAYAPVPRTPPATSQTERLTYIGSVPGSHIVEEPVRQWAPRLQRITTLGPDPVLADVTLPTLRWEDLPHRSPELMAAELKQQLPEDWRSAAWSVLSPGKSRQWHSLDDSPVTLQRLSEVLKTVTQLLSDAPNSQGQTRGVFHLLSELSPTAAPDCEDLVLTSRPALVLVREVSQGHYLVLRVVFSPDSKE